MWRSHNRLALGTMLLALLLSALFASRQASRTPDPPPLSVVAGGKWKASDLSLEVRPSPLEGRVSLVLSNKSTSPARFYNSLQAVPEGEGPGFTSIRLRDAGGRILQPIENIPEEFWTPDLTQTRKVPARLETLEPGQQVALTTDVVTLLNGFPDRHRIGSGSEAQVRCVIFLDHGLLEAHSEWFALPKLIEAEPPG